MKRVLSIATLYPNAHRPQFGAFVARQLEALAARGDWQVTVINPIGIPPLPFGPYRALPRLIGSAVEHGVEVHRIRFPLIPKIGGPLNPRLIARSILPAAAKLHAALPFDLVDAQFCYPDGPAAAHIAADLGLPLSIKARGADISHWGRLPYALRGMLRAARQANGLLAVSEALAEDMAALGFPRGKIAVHYTGLDRERFHPLGRQECRARLGAEYGIDFSGPAPVLASVGALIRRKGQALVLQALTQLPGARLLLVGDGPDRAMLDAQARQDGLAGRVHFLGTVDHDILPVVLSAADAMVLPSASEGLANAWVEALACGTPLVITGAGGARELLRDPAAGRIVARDPAAIAGAVGDLLANPPGLEAVAATVADFSWQANAAQLAGHYDRLIGAPAV